MKKGKLRLDHFLSQASLGSRREVLRLIKGKKIRVNERVITDPAFKVDPQRDLVLFENRPLSYQPFFYYKFYKPQGVVTSTRDREKTIFDLIPGKLPHREELFPAGRLDKDAEGLIVLTNDGEMAHRMTHPRWKLPKVYEVCLDKPLKAEDKLAIEAGLELKEGKTLPCEIYLLDKEGLRLKMIVREGRYHLIKRLFGKRGYLVKHLKRIAIGPVELGDLKPGEIEGLKEEELEKLRSLLFPGEFKQKP